MGASSRSEISVEKFPLLPPPPCCNILSQTGGNYFLVSWPLKRATSASPLDTTHAGHHVHDGRTTDGKHGVEVSEYALEQAPPDQMSSHHRVGLPARLCCEPVYRCTILFLQARPATLPTHGSRIG